MGIFTSTNSYLHGCELTPIMLENQGKMDREPEFNLALLRVQKCNLALFY